MTIRYVRDGLRIKRLELAADLTALHRQAASAEETARDVKARTHALKVGLLGDNRRRVGLLRGAAARASGGEAPGPLVPPSAVRRARRVAKVSQRDLAAGLKISRSSIAEAERGVRLPLPVLATWTALVLAAGEEAAS
jgi:DNA-binding XRE family transcriptional regulator